MKNKKNGEDEGAIFSFSFLSLSFSRARSPLCDEFFLTSLKKKTFSLFSISPEGRRLPSWEAPPPP